MIRIAIVDDHAIVRAGLRQFFAIHSDLSVVAEASNGNEALALVLTDGAGIDVMVMDLSMGELGGVGALAAIKAHAPHLPVLIFSAFAEVHYATSLLQHGASGYLSKDCEPEQLVNAVRTVAKGQKYISAAVAERLAGTSAASLQKPLHQSLSKRELQVFLHLAAGEAVGHIATQMSLSIKTVSTYRTRIMEKLNLASNSDLTYYALKNGLIE